MEILIAKRHNQQGKFPGEAQNCLERVLAQLMPVIWLKHRLVILRLSSKSFLSLRVNCKTPHSAKRLLNVNSVTNQRDTKNHAKGHCVPRDTVSLGTLCP